MPRPSDPSIPGSPPVAISQDVVRLYQECLGRLPENDGAVEGRIGRLYEDVKNEICNSQEAINYRASKVPVIVQPPGAVKPGDKPKESTPFIGGIPGLDAALNWLKDVLGAKLADARAAADEAAKHIQAQVDVVLSKALPAIQHAAQNLQSQLSTTVATLIPNTLSLLGAGLGGIGNLISTFLSNAADIGDIVDVAAQGLKDHESGLEDFVHNAFGSAFGFGMEAALRALLPKIDSPNPIADGFIAAMRANIAAQNRG